MENIALPLYYASSSQLDHHQCSLFSNFLMKTAASSSYCHNWDLGSILNKRQEECIN